MDGSDKKIWQKDPDYFVPPSTKEQYIQAVEKIASDFFKQFEHLIPVYISETGRVRKRLILDTQFPMLKNILIMSIERCLDQESMDRSLVAYEKLGKLFSDASKEIEEDVAYIHTVAKKFAAKEYDFG